MSSPEGFRFLATRGFRLGVAGTQLTQSFAERLQALDLTYKQVGLLALVDAGLATSQREISTQLQVAPSLVVSLVDQLGNRGAVTRERSATDRRIQVVALTDVGRDLLAQSTRIAADLDEELYARLTPTGKKALETLLAELGPTFPLD
ncbi:DNA-binding MarR family transcriptional regulator [Mycetocola sp. BIGb0189]|uniref:MarR family winged helix-turn-helix transcriptional regulator n=1 Tax=Mycetocola sp. BIGb0189 TaxID=2940604 RepID=UPI0021679290|nr:MarR family winged helix-turn-helix transcriptional regulator [Mycetocola sp. BIGb0189]MCS4277461.1 DNA-binding MarR family transcriptional regulator [Mycetocola sp. BIGb0189]